MRNYFLLCFLLMMVGSGFSQESSLNVDVKPDSVQNLYFKDVSDSLMINVRTLWRSYTLNYEHVGSGNELHVEPTGQLNLGLGVNYKWFGIAVNFGLPSSEEEIEKYGETKRQGLNIGVFGNSVSGSIIMQHYKGFYLSNYQDTNTGIHVQAPSLETYNINLSALYFFNHKRFSYKAAYVRNAIQTKSAGSLVAGAYLSYDISESEVPIGGSDIPDSVQNQFDVLGVWSRTYGVSLGYSRTFVIKNKFIINGTIVPGIGSKKLMLNLGSGSSYSNAGLAYRLDFNLSIGYEAKKWLAGMSFTNSEQFYEIEGLRISPSSSSFRLFVAKRFGTLKLKKNKKN